MAVPQSLVNALTTWAASLASTVVADFAAITSVARVSMYSAGTGPNQYDTTYGNSIKLAGAPMTLDLTNLTNADLSTTTFARVREYFFLDPDNAPTHVVKHYAGAANGWAPLPPVANYQTVAAEGGIIYMSDPTTSGVGGGLVVTNTSKTITLDPGANTVTIFVFIVGTSVA